MHKNIISLTLLTVSFYVVGAAQEPQQIPSLKELALQRVVQIMASKEQAQQFARDPQQCEEYVESHGVNSGAIKEIIVDQLLKPYKNKIYQCRDCPLSSFIASVAWHPGGELLALGLVYGHISIWDSTTGKELNRLGGARSTVRSVAWHPDGELLAAGFDDKKVRIWNRAQVRTLKVLEGHEGRVLSVSWHPDGALLASGSDDGTVRIWDRHTGQEVRQLQYQDQFISGVNSVSWHPDGELLASGCSDGTVRIWDRNTDEELRQLRNQVSSPVNAVSWHPDGKLLASALSDNLRISIWDTTTGQEINELKGHLPSGLSVWPPRESVSWHPNGNLLALGSCYGTCIFDMHIGKIKEQYCFLDAGSVAFDSCNVSAVWNPKRNLLALAKRDGTACIWDVDAHQRLIDSLSLMQALYFTHRMEHAGIMQVADKGKQEEEAPVGGAVDQNQDLARVIQPKFDLTQDNLHTLKRKRSEGLALSSKRSRFESSSSSSSSSGKQEQSSQAYMKDLEASLPDAFKRMLHKNHE